MNASVFQNYAGTIARAVLGEPNTEQSSKDQLRFGSFGSLSVQIQGERKGTWHDHEENVGGGMLDLIQRRKGLDKPGALDFVRSIGIPLDPPKASSGGSRVVATYAYRDADGGLLYEVVRREPKDFRQRRPEGNGWVWSLGDVKRVPYRLPELLAADPTEMVFVVEGEKDVDRLRDLGCIATCNSGGAAKAGQRTKWPHKFREYFADRDVVILADNDDAGEAHAKAVADNLTSNGSTTSSVRILRLPNLPDKGDVSDWLAGGGTLATLRDLVAETPVYAALKQPRTAPSAELVPHPSEVAVPGDVGTYLLNEDSIALAFTEAHGDHLRYCHHSCSWFVWTGSIWHREETQLGFSLAREICRAAALNLPPAHDDRKAMAKASTAASVERLAKADRRLAVEASTWDRDPWLLGTPGGTVDLKTGELRASRQADHITKKTAIAPAQPGTPHPIWDAFLVQATGGDKKGGEKDGPELAAFLQRLVGYCLTGDVTEETIAFLYGDGGTGKGTFVGTIAAIMGGYAVSVPIEVFTAGARLNLEYYRATMAGARLVTASETEGGATWAESQLKEMSGNETPLSARQPYGKAFTYRPQFKIVLIGNHAPRLKARSKAMERRLRIVPFKHQPAKADQSLKERLRAEYPAILRWAIEGCTKWQQDRLGTCVAVAAESESYFEQQDHFGRWLEERCKVDASLSETPSRLHSDFLSWAKENNETAITPGEFREMVERTKGLRYAKNDGKRFVRGIGLMPKQDDLDADRRRYGEG